MGNKVTGEKVMANLFWGFMERFGAQIVTFGVTIVVARILAPEAYGVVSLITVFVSILQVFIEHGLGSALIQKKDSDDLDFSTIFYTNIALSVTLYVLLFLAAPFIAKFYGEPTIAQMTRVMGILVLVGSLKNIQQAYVSKNFMFKKFFVSTLFGTIISGLIGIFMALKGFGSWAVIAQVLSNSIIDTIMLWLTVGWRPKKMFSLERLKSLYKYGLRLLGASLVDTIYADLRTLVIGKRFSRSDLAFYNKGRRFPYLIIKNVGLSIDRVMFPTMSQVQDEADRLKKVAKYSVKTCGYLIIPMMAGMALVGRDFLLFLLTEKWLPALPFLLMHCVIYAFLPLITSNRNMLKAVGADRTFLIVTIVSRTLGIAALLITMWINPLWIAIGELICQPIVWIIVSWQSGKYSHYGFFEQLKDILPYLAMTAVMGVPVYLVGMLNIGVFIRLVLQIVVGIAVYALISIVFKVDMYVMFLNKFKGILSKRKGKSKSKASAVKTEEIKEVEDTLNAERTDAEKTDLVCEEDKIVEEIMEER